MERYAKISEKNKREIVLLRGDGCRYRRCAFCDYYLDENKDAKANFLLNKSVLDKVDGEFKNLEVINSGSVFELDEDTLNYIKELCLRLGITTLHFEAHYMYKDRIESLRKRFEGINLKMKLGLETFDCNLRENHLRKGIKESNPKIIAEGFDEANFLFGVSGQSVESMLFDVETGLKYFERICINVMCENSSQIKPDKEVISLFLDKVYPLISDNQRIDILVKNTDFGVGD